MATRYNIVRADDRWTKLSMAQEGTIAELVDKLKSHQIALMVRPTGFGKTHIMIELAKRCGYENVLYLYPIEVIRQSIFESYHKPGELKFAATLDEKEADNSLPYIEFCTYDKMLEDYTNAYRFMGNKPWSKMTASEKEALKQSWDKMTDTKQAEYRKNWMKKRFKNIDLLILDEAHRAGAEGFLSYWPDIHSLTEEGLKSERLHVLGATATPLRTDTKVDIEQEVFYYTHGDEKSARIGDFGLDLCWSFGIMQRPYLIRGMLDKEEAKQVALSKIREQNKAKKIKGTGNFEKDSDIEDELDRLLDFIKPIDLVISEGVDNVAHDSLVDHEYIRLLAFHSDSKSLVENYAKINNAVKKALCNDEFGYKHINSFCITSKIAAIEKAGIPIDDVSIISKRDTEIKQNPDSGSCTIDIIHSIDMLNMGYHVGKVTGIITMRATGSEIIYYQQIGRCISVRDDNKPLIIDLVNASSELEQRAIDSQRQTVLEKIKTFVDNCDQQEHQNNAVYQFYRFCGMCLDTLPLDDGMIKFWYFNRRAPIYYIYSIGRSLGKKETLESMLKRIDDMCFENKDSIILDTEFCLSISGIDKRVIKSLILPQPEKLKTARQKVKL